MLEIINRLSETSHPWNEILYYSETLTDERLDSELEDDPPDLPVIEPSFHKVETVARFNLARDSLQTSTERTPPIHERTPIHQPHEAPPATALQTPLVPRSQQLPRAPPKRDSWNSPKESPMGTAVTKLQTSMSNFRVRKGLPEWSEDSKKACCCSKTQEGLSLSWKERRDVRRPDSR